MILIAVAAPKAGHSEDVLHNASYQDLRCTSEDAVPIACLELVLDQLIKTPTFCGLLTWSRHGEEAPDRP